MKLAEKELLSVTKSYLRVKFYLPVYPSVQYMHIEYICIDTFISIVEINPRPSFLISRFLNKHVRTSSKVTNITLPF